MAKEEKVGCVECGQIVDSEEVVINEDGETVCPECGAHHTIITFQAALDFISLSRNKGSRDEILEILNEYNEDYNDFS